MWLIVPATTADTPWIVRRLKRSSSGVRRFSSMVAWNRRSSGIVRTHIGWRLSAGANIAATMQNTMRIEAGRWRRLCQREGTVPRKARQGTRLQGTSIRQINGRAKARKPFERFEMKAWDARRGTLRYIRLHDLLQYADSSLIAFFLLPF